MGAFVEWGVCVVKKIMVEARIINKKTVAVAVKRIFSIVPSLGSKLIF
jgi:hypothetical protein